MALHVEYLTQTVVTKDTFLYFLRKIQENAPNSPKLSNPLLLRKIQRE